MKGAPATVGLYIRQPPYKDLLAGIHTALAVNEGIIKLTGGPGCGKTALCTRIARELEAEGKPVVFFMNPPRDAETLQQDILRRLDLPATGNFTRTLTRALLARAAGQDTLLLIFDDAHEIDARTFTAIRLLCNIQDERRTLVRVIICGPDELDRKLATPDYRGLGQHLSQSFRLEPLTREQVQDFRSAWWLARDVVLPPLAERALQQLHRDCQGRPDQLLELLATEARQLDEQRARRERQDAVAADAAIKQARAAELAQHPPPPPAEPQTAAPPEPAAITPGEVALVVEGIEQLRPKRVFTRPRVYAGLALLMLLGTTVAAWRYIDFGPVPAAVVTTTIPPQSPLPAPAQPVAAVVAEPASETVAAVAPEPAAEPAADDATEPETESAADLVIAPAEGPAADVVAEADEGPAADVLAEAVEEPVAGIVAALETESVSEIVAVSDAEPLPEPLAGPDAQIVAMLTAWIDSWQGQDLSAYFSFYHSTFVPAQDVDLASWRAARTRSISAAREISITFDTVTLTAATADQATVQFMLRYRSAGYSDDTLKEMQVVRESGRWQFVAERNLSVERLQ